jgi:TPR repeat protein
MSLESSLRRFAPVFLFIVCVSVFANSPFSGFVWDDKDIIEGREGFYNDLRNVKKAFLMADTVRLEDKTPYYRPFTYLTFFFDYNLWRLNPFWYHIENLLLHASVVILFYLLILKVFEKPRIAFFAALLFSVHPVNAEAVNFISGGRNTLLCAVFSIISLIFLKKRGNIWVFFSAIAYFLALLSKEQAIVLPFFLVSMAVLTREKGLRPAFSAAAIFTGVTAIYLFMRMSALGAFDSGDEMEASLRKLGFISSVLFENLRLMIFPFKLNAFYARDAMGFAPHKAVLALAGIALLVYFSVRRNAPEPLRAGALWVLWGFLPISNIIVIPSAPVAERYLYMPLLGFCLIFGYLIGVFYAKQRILATFMLVLIITAFGIRTYARSFVWKDEIRLFKGMIASNPQNSKAYFNLGNAYMGMGMPDIALGYWEETVRVDPKETRAYNNIGNIYYQRGDYKKAMEYYENALKAEPGNFLIHFNLGMAADISGDKGKALFHYEAFLRYASRSPDMEQREKAKTAEKQISAIKSGR